MNKRPSWVLNLILIAVGVVFALILVGGVLLAFPQLRPNTIRFTVEMGDIFYHQAAWMRPPENGKDVLATYWLEWDQEGFRVPHWRADSYPVVALGDSFTEAPNAPKPWPDVLATALDVPVRNLGFRGFGPREEMQSFERYGQPQKVETVVIGFFEGNDLSNAYTTRNNEFEPPSTVTDRSMIPTDIAAIPDRDERYPMQIDINGEISDVALLEGYVWMLNGSYETYLDSRNLALTTRNWQAIAEAAPQACVIVAYFPDKSHIYLPYLTVEDQPILMQKTMETVLDNRNRLIQQPAPEMTFESILANLDHQRDAVEEAAAAIGLPFVDLTPVLAEAAASGELTYYTYDTHWNQRGHELAGNTIAAFLETQPCED
jgi:hypothetical protein